MPLLVINVIVIVVLLVVDYLLGRPEKKIDYGSPGSASTNGNGTRVDTGDGFEGNYPGEGMDPGDLDQSQGYIGAHPRRRDPDDGPDPNADNGPDD